ncbi:MAG TPA: lipoprotein [Xanthobacteraceae bacterium]
MTLIRDRRLGRLAVIAALGAAFALAGCGRKGPLDPPPSAAIAPPPPSNQPSLGETNDPNMTGFVRPPPATKTVAPPAPAAPPEQRSFFLDFLIK